MERPEWVLVIAWLAIPAMVAVSLFKRSLYMAAIGLLTRDTGRIGLAPEFSFTDSLSVRHRLAYVGTNGHGHAVFVARADGSECREVFRGTRRWVSCPLAWGPDGRTLYCSHDQILAIDVGSGTVRAVTDFPEEDQFSVTWFLTCSPDGRSLVFTQRREHAAGSRTGVSSRLCIIGTDGSGFRVLLGSAERDVWRADAQWQCNLLVAQLNSKQQDAELWAMDLNGENQRCIASFPEAPGEIALSPDGEHVAYSRCGGSQGLHLLHLPSGKRRQLAGFGSSPSWSPDGTRIAFMGEDYQLWLAGPDNGRLQRLVWFEGRNYPTWLRKAGWAVAPAWSRDGRLLWFSLTKTRRRRPDPQAVESLTQHDFAEIPEEQRQFSRRASIEMLRWGCVHKVGMVDFQDRRVWITQGHWTEVAWYPLAGWWTAGP